MRFAPGMILSYSILPPLQSVTDSLALSRLADGTVMVVRYGKTTYEVLGAALKKLGELGGKPFLAL